MSALTVWLTVIVLLSAAVALVWKRNSEVEEWHRSVLRIYVILTCAVLCGMLWSYQRQIDTIRKGTLRQRRIQHVGYYLAPAATSNNVMFQFGGDQAGTPHFSHPALADNDFLEVSAGIGSARVQAWTIRWGPLTKPLRIGGTAVNIPSSMWLVPGDQFSACLPAHADTPAQCITITLRRARAAWRPWKHLDSFEVQVPGHSPVAGQRTIQYALRESDLLLMKNDWHSAVQSLRDPRWIQLLNAIVWTRETRDDAESRLGVFLSPEIAGTGATAFKNGQPATVSAAGSYDVHHDSNLFYGMGRRDALQVELSLTPMIDMTVAKGSARASVAKVVPLRFVNPVNWPVPPVDLTQSVEEQRFVLTSAQDYLPLNGFSLRLPDVQSPFYATAHWKQDLTALEVSRPYDRVELRADDKSPEMLGRSTDGVLIRVVDVPAGVSWWPAPLMIVISGLLFVLGIGKIQERRFAFHFALVWTLATTVICVRYIVAYRISALAPWNLEPGEALKFGASASDSQAGVLLVPLLMVVMAIAFWQKWKWRWARALGIISLFACALFFWQTSKLEATLIIFAGVVPQTRFSFRQLRSLTLGTGQPSRARRRLAYLFLILPPLAVLIGWAFGKRESFIVPGLHLNLRINIATHLLLVVVLVLFLRLHGARSLASRILIATSIWSTLGLEALVIRDRGTLLVYLFGLLATTLLLGFEYEIPVRETSGLSLSQQPETAAQQPPYVRLIRGLLRRRVIAVFAILMPFLLLVAAVVIIERPWQQVGDVMRIKPALGTADDLLIEHENPHEIDLDVVRSALLQRWEMQAFSAAGRTPAGYGQAPLSNAGMSYATVLTDCSFATLVMAEHGWSGAGLLMGFLIGIGWLIARHGNYMRRRSLAPVPLLAIGGFFAWNALYMGMANLGYAPFTGQNVPGLSFGSRGDLFQFGLLLLIAVFLMAQDRTLGSAAGTASRRTLLAQTDEKRRGSAWVIRAVFALAVLALIAFGFSSAYLLRTVDPKADFNLISDENRKKEYDRIAQGLPDESRQSNTPRNWEFEQGSDRLAPTSTAEVSSIELTLVKQYNDRVDKRDPRGGLLVLVGDADDSSRAVQLKREHYNVGSPFNPQEHLWAGSIVAAGSSSLPMICGLLPMGSTRGHLAISNCLAFSESGQARAADECFASVQEREHAPTVAHVLSGAPAPDYTCRAPSGGTLFELRRRGPAIEVHPYRVEHGHGDEVLHAFVDGEPLTSPRTLPPYSIFTVRYRNQEKNLFHIGSQQVPVAYTVWRNGLYTRLYPMGDAFPMAYALGKAADELTPELRAQRRTRIDLAMDLGLEEQLQSFIRDYALQTPPYNNPDEKKRLAITVLDAFSGAVKAVPAWPAFDPSDPQFEETLAQADPRTEEFLLRNPNLVNHVAGSTMKPLVFSALASQLNGTLDLRRLTFVNSANVPDPIHSHTQVGGLWLGGRWDCNSSVPTITARGLLVNSYDFYEGSLGLLGTLLSAEDVFGTPNNTGVFRRSTSGNVSYNGTPYQWDMTRLRNSTRESAWTIAAESQRHDFKASTLRNTLLFRGLVDVFSLPSPDPLLPSTPAWDGAASEFLAGLPAERHGQRLTTVLPDSVEIKPFRNAYPDLILCVLGGGDACRYNNIWMAQSAARIATGLKIRASLINGPTPAFQHLPQPLSNNAWRSDALLRPMADAYLDNAGTAHQLLSPKMRATLPPGWTPFRLPAGYMGLFKTGTLQEGKDLNGNERESECLLFVIGRTEGGSFVPGMTLAGFIYMQDSKIKENRGDMRKFGFAPGALNIIVRYLESHRTTPALPHGLGETAAGGAVPRQRQSQ